MATIFSHLLYSHSIPSSSHSQTKLSFKSYISKQRYENLPEKVTCPLCGKPTYFMIDKVKMLDNTTKFFKNGRLWKVGKLPYKFNQPIKIHCHNETFYLEYSFGIDYYHNNILSVQETLI